MERDRLWVLDVLVVLGLTGLGALAVHFAIPVARLVATGLLVLFLPGYALTSALFPRARISGTTGPTGRSAMERLGVAAALSPALVAFVALVANFTPYGITRTPILVGTCGLTVAFALVGAERRFRLAPSKRFAPSLPLAGVSFTNGSRPRDSSSTTVYNLALGVSLLCVLGSAGFALAVGPDSAEFTGLSVEVNDQSVERAAALEPGESVTIVVENHEGEARDYTAVVVAQRVAERDDGTVHVTGQRGLTTRQVSVAAGERGTATFEAAPLSGEMDEVAVLLYENDAPTNPTRESAYRVLTLEIA